MTKSPKPVTNMPQSPSLAEGWHMVQFGNVARKISDIVDRKNCDLDHFIAGEHMQTDDFRIKEWGTIDDGYLGPAFNHKFSKGQILYGSRRTYLRKVSLPHFNGVCANTTFVIEPTGDDLIPELLPFVMQSAGFNEQSIRMSKGSTNPYINWKDIACYEFAVPEKEQQRRIATTLWATEDCIVKGERFVAAAEKAKQVLMRELFSKGIGHKEFKDVNGFGKVPKNWDVFQLHQIINEPIRNGAFIQKNESDISVAFLNVVDVYKNAVVNISDLQKINCTQSDFDNYQLRENDLLYVRSSLRREGIAQCCMIDSLPERIIFDCHLMRVRLNAEKNDPKYLLYYSISDKGRKQLINISKTTTMSTVDQKDLGSFSIPIPPLPEQRQIVGILTHCDETIAAARENVGAVKALKMRLINDMLNSEKSNGS